MMLFCSIEQAQGIVDSFGRGIYWHVDGWPDFPESAGVTETVFLEYIEEDEYTIIRDALAAGLPVLEPEPEPDPEPSDDELEVVRSGIMARMSTACKSIIAAGVDVVLSDGESHRFSLTTEDQLNLVSLSALILQGQSEIPYHADDEACTFFSADDFQAIVTAATGWKTYHESYFNSLKAYVLSMETVEKLASVEYGMEIPVEYQSIVYQHLIAATEGGAE